MTDDTSPCHWGNKGNRCYRSRGPFCKWIFVWSDQGSVTRRMLQSRCMQWWICYPVSWWWSDIGELAMDVQANADEGSSHAYRCMQMNVVANFAPFIHVAFLVIFTHFFLLLLFIVFYYSFTDNSNDSHASYGSYIFFRKIRYIFFRRIQSGLSLQCTWAWGHLWNCLNYFLILTPKTWLIYFLCSYYKFQLSIEMVYNFILFLNRCYSSFKFYFVAFVQPIAGHTVCVKGWYTSFSPRNLKSPGYFIESNLNWIINKIGKNRLFNIVQFNI